jgi:hypothetical protein
MNYTLKSGGKRTHICTRVYAICRFLTINPIRGFLKQTFCPYFVYGNVGKLKQQTLITSMVK